MIELNSTYPDSEEIALAFDRSMSMVREGLNDLEQLMKRVLEGKTYIDDDQLAAILKCNKNEIPARIPKYRASRVGYLYKLSEIYEYIEERRIGGK